MYHKNTRKQRLKSENLTILPETGTNVSEDISKLFRPLFFTNFGTGIAILPVLETQRVVSLSVPASLVDSGRFVEVYLKCFMITLSDVDNRDLMQKVQRLAVVVERKVQSCHVSGGVNQFLANSTGD